MAASLAATSGPAVPPSILLSTPNISARKGQLTPYDHEVKGIRHIANNGQVAELRLLWLIVFVTSLLSNIEDAQSEGLWIGICI